MLATRIVPVVLYRGHEAVKGRGFDSWRSVGLVRQAVRVYERRNVDELVLLDIAATPQGRGPDVALVRDMAGECFFPLTVGGGVTHLDHVRDLLANGADKVALNTAAVETPDLISDAARKFGRQAVVVSIDVSHGSVATHCGKVDAGIDPVAWAMDVERLGAGEILLNVVERDGTLAGYDLDLIRAVSAAVSIPVIASGGAGTYDDFLAGLAAGAHAVAAGAIWHFTDATPGEAAEHLAAHGVPVRRKLAA